jgi:tetratricopeptide (TPR) repeat protein
MSKLYSLFLIILLLLPNFALATQTDNSKTFVITNVNVIPMDSERVLKNQNVVIKDGKIIALGSPDKVKTPKGATEINGLGKYLIPGLFDMHIHIREGSEKDLTMYIANGVTTVQSMHGSSWHLELREKIANGELLGPRFFTTGPTTATARVNSPEEAEKFVLEQKKAGYDAIKQYGNGSNSMTRETYHHLIEVAKRENMRVVGHAPRNMPFSVVLEEGQNSIDHAEEIYYTYTPIQDFYKPHVDFQFGRMSLEDYRKANPAFPELKKMTPVIKKLAQEAKKANIAFTPTLTSFETIWRQTTSQFDEMLKEPELQYVEPLTRASWGPQTNRYRSNWLPRLKEMDKMLKQSLELQKMMVKEFDKAGVPVMTGTDAPLTFVYPGFTLHHELELFVESGLTPFRALRAATITPAKVLKIDSEVGTIVVGKQADLVLLDANPLDNIKNTQKISGVFTKGRWLSKKEIDQSLEKIAADYRPFWEEIQKFQQFLDNEEIKEGLEVYKNSKNKSEDLAGYLEGFVNTVGYKYIRANDLDKALEVLKLNTEYFPNGFNTWDSLAEVYMLKGEKDLAIKFYKKSLELNPNNNNAVEQIKKLESEK